MAPLTFHLIVCTDKPTFLTSLRSLPKASRPLWLGETKHWIHEPSLSARALTGSDPAPTLWEYLLIAPSFGSNGLDLPHGVEVTKHKWSITAPVDATWLDTLASGNYRRKTGTPPSLPPGWSATDHSGIGASIPPADLSASLGLCSRPLGQKDPILLKDFIATFATEYTGPVAMFNLLSYIPPGGREKYFGYIAAFQASVGVKYGGEAVFLGSDVQDWSSREEDGGKDEGEGWKDYALVWYPSLWHFGKMLDDPEYAAVDREYKRGAIRDNPLICCVEIDVGYSG